MKQLLAHLGVILKPACGLKDPFLLPKPCLVKEEWILRYAQDDTGAKLKHLWLILLCLTFTYLLSACQPQNNQGSNQESGDPTSAQAPLPTRTVSLLGPGGATIQVLAEVADAEPERAAGLMFRTSLSSGTGMLFVFEQPQRLGFWMKNTLIPLDLLFFNGAALVAVIPHAKPHDETPLEPPMPADKVLEVPGGWAAANGVGVGWRLAQPASNRGQELGTR